MKTKSVLALLALISNTGCDGCLSDQEINKYSTAPFEVLDLGGDTESLDNQDYTSVLLKSPQEPMYIAISEDSRQPTSEEEKALTGSINYWNLALGRQALVLDDSKANITIRFTDRVEVKQNDIPSNSRGVASLFIIPSASGKAILCKVQIRNSVSNSWMVYTHELGHCLGIGHSKSTASVMYGPCLNPESHIMKESIDLREKFAQILAGSNE